MPRFGRGRDRLGGGAVGAALGTRTGSGVFVVGSCAGIVAARGLGVSVGLLRRRELGAGDYGGERLVGGGDGLQVVADVHGGGREGRVVSRS